MTPVDIANNALLLVADKSISSLDAAGAGAALCNQFYEQCRNSVFRSHPWNSATKRIVLSPLKEKPAFGYSNQFALPSDWVRTLSIGEPHLDYAIEGNRILANVKVINLLYIFKNEDINTWDDLLIEAVSLALAAKIAYPITKSVSKEESLKNDLELLLRKARTVNGQETPPETLGDYPLYQSRF